MDDKALYSDSRLEIRTLKTENNVKILFDNLVHVKEPFFQFWVLD